MYRLPEAAVAGLIEDLTLSGDPQSAEAEVFLDHPRLKLLERGLMLSIRFGLADGFSEIRLETRDKERARPRRSSRPARSRTKGKWCWRARALGDSYWAA